jgi:ketosteroid isomerase-like protein
MTQDTAVDIAFLDRFADAWNRHDTEAILAAMTPDCVMQMPMGPDVGGTVYRGQAEVRQGIERVFSLLPDVRYHNPTHFIAGGRGVTEWVLTATGPNGPIEAEGCDVFTFRDGKIALKNSYRKQRA